MKGLKTADEFYSVQGEFGAELRALRLVLLATGMKETIKWGIPVYTVDGKNVVGTCAFKKYFGLWFYQGVFLKDKANVLINAQEGKTKAMRQWRFKEGATINKRLIQQYLEEAIENQKAGKEMKAEQKPLILPGELIAVLENDSLAGERFEALTLGKKRDYAEYIETAKRDETKENRLARIIPMIKDGVGLNDKYK